jgi:hypothetical protein
MNAHAVNLMYWCNDNRATKAARMSTPLSGIVGYTSSKKSKGRDYDEDGDDSDGDDMSDSSKDKTSSAGNRSAIAFRKDFNPLAHWCDIVRTNEDGIAIIKYQAGDNITKYRLMALAIMNGTHFGIGEASMSVRQQLNVRPSLPR